MTCSCSTTASTTTQPAPATGTRFQVDDMSCSHCVGVITRALAEGMPGVDCAVDLATHQVTVGGDPERAAALIRDAGYEPRLVTA